MPVRLTNRFLAWPRKTLQSMIGMISVVDPAPTHYLPVGHVAYFRNYGLLLRRQLHGGCCWKLTRMFFRSGVRGA